MWHKGAARLRPTVLSLATGNTANTANTDTSTDTSTTEVDKTTRNALSQRQPRFERPQNLDNANHSSHLSTADVENFVVSVVGGMIMDQFSQAEWMPKNDESLDADGRVYKPGGKGSNTSIAVYRSQYKKPIYGSKPEPIEPIATSDERRRGAVVYLNTAVGNDQFGKELTKNLKQNGIDTHGVRTFPGQMTGICAVFINPFTKESRDIGYPDTNTNWTPREPDSIICLTGKEPQTLDLVVCHLETKHETVETLLATVTEHGIETLLNPSPLPGAQKKLKAIEERRRAAKYFLGQGVKNVVSTVGVEGAFYATATCDGVVPAVPKLDVKDTTGAGYYAMDYVRQRHRGEWDIRKAVELGCRAAAKTIQQFKAQDVFRGQMNLNISRRSNSVVPHSWM
ncbi:hypothetical protein N0V90_000158 [Kalmusia sp. IMI 367209]|nr:hypothetical protein N0V90_000158 [Kalmusia sp. IMI 367209]